MASTTKRKPPPRRRPTTSVDSDDSPATSSEDVGEAFEEVKTRVAAERNLPQTARTRAAFAQARAATASLTPEVIVQQLSGTGLAVQKMLDEVSTQLLAEEKRLAEIRTAVAAEEAELEELYGKETAGAALEVLIANHEQKVAELEGEYAEKAAALAEKLRADEQEAKDAADEQARGRATEEADYAFKKGQSRRAAEEAWVNGQAQKAREAQEKEYHLARGWAIREEALAEREKELVSLRELAAGVEARIKAESDKQVAIATNSLKRDLEGKAALAAAEANTKFALAEQANRSLAMQVANAQEQIKRLETQLDAARASVQDIATSAMKEAGSSKALAEVTSFAQRENGTPSRKS